MAYKLRLTCAKLSKFQSNPLISQYHRTTPSPYNALVDTTEKQADGGLQPQDLAQLYFSDSLDQTGGLHVCTCVHTHTHTGLWEEG